MTTQLHTGDNYRVSFGARIIRATANHIVLDQTCFFGPHRLIESDTGMVGDCRVAGLRRSNPSTVEHLLAPHKGTMPTVGQRVECSIDWECRYRRMKLHTAQHLVELAARATHDVNDVMLQPVDARSAAVIIDFGRVSVDCQAIQDWIETAIADDLSCSLTRSGAPPFGQVWHVYGYGHHHCDGLHLNSTSEIDCVRLTSTVLKPARLAVNLRVESDSTAAEPDDHRGFTTSNERNIGFRLGSPQGRDGRW